MIKAEGRYDAGRGSLKQRYTGASEGRESQKERERDTLELRQEPSGHFAAAATPAAMTSEATGGTQVRTHRKEGRGEQHSKKDKLA